MSKIPKPAALPKPKSFQAMDEINTQEHQELLDWLWENIREIVEQWMFPPKNADDIKQDKIEAIEDFRNDASEIRDHLRTALHSNQDEDYWLGIEIALKKAEKFLASMGIPKLPDDFNKFQIVEKHYQQPISIEKLRSGDRQTEIIGFIDVDVLVNEPMSLSLTGLPLVNWMTKAAELEKVVFKKPKWKITRMSGKRMWFDVRTNPPLLAVLLRELKTLREIGGQDTIITVVVEDLPDHAIKTLSHEGFLVLSRKQFKETNDWLH